MQVGVSSNGPEPCILIDPEDNRSYTCLRKKGSAPQDMYDGELIVENHVGPYVDKKIRGGNQYFYAIEYQDTPDSFAVHGPLAVFPTPNNLTSTATDNSIILHFTSPIGSTTTQIYRSEGGDFTQIAELNHDIEKFEDSDVRFGITYTYGLMSTYPAGNSGYIKIEQKLVKPVEPPTVYVEANAGGFDVEYDGFDEILLGFTTARLPIHSSRTLADDISHKITILDHTTVGPNKYRIKIPENSIGFLYPILKEGAFYIIGEPTPVSSLPDPTISIQKNDNSYSILFTNLPPNYTGVKILIDSNRTPSSSDDSCDIFSDFISADALKLRRNCINITMHKSIGHLKAFTAFLDDEGETIYSVGVYKKLTGIRPTINYKIKGGLGKTTITFETRDALALLPPIVVVCGDMGVPLRKNDGLIIEQINPMPFKGGACRTTVNVSKSDLKNCRAFFENDSDNDAYSLNQIM